MFFLVLILMSISINLSEGQKISIFRNITYEIDNENALYKNNGNLLSIIYPFIFVYNYGNINIMKCFENEYNSCSVNSTINLESNENYFEIQTVYTDDNKNIIMIFMQSKDVIDLYEFDMDNSKTSKYLSLKKDINYKNGYKMNKNVLDNSIYIYSCNNNTLSLYSCYDLTTCDLSKDIKIKLNFSNSETYVKQCLMIDYVVTIITSNGIYDELFFYSFYILNNNFIYLTNFTIPVNNDFYDIALTSKLATYSLASVKKNLITFYYCSEFQSEFCFDGEEFLLQQEDVYKIYQTYGFMYTLNFLNYQYLNTSLEITNTFYRGLNEYNYTLIKIDDIENQKNISCSSWFYPSIIACNEKENFIIYQFDGFEEPTDSPSVTPTPKGIINKYVYQPECFKYDMFFTCVYKCPGYTNQPFMNCDDLKCWSNCMRQQRCYNNAFETFCNEQNEIRLCGTNCETLKINEGNSIKNVDFVILKILILFLFIFMLF